MYLLTHEWNEGRNVEPHFPLYHITCYGKVTEERKDDIIEQMEKWSQYDYCTYDSYVTEEEYNERIEFFRSKGAEITFSNPN